MQISRIRYTACTAQHSKDGLDKATAGGDLVSLKDRRIMTRQVETPEYIRYVYRTQKMPWTHGSGVFSVIPGISIVF